MIEELQQKNRSILRKFTLGWLLLTIIVALVLFVFQLQKFNLHREQAFQASANHIAFEIDDMLQSAMQSAFTIPFLSVSKNKTNCYSLLPAMRRIVFNHLSIAGLFISDQRKILCSTVANDIPLSNYQQQSTILHGPYQLADKSGDFLVYQQRIGAFNFGVVFLIQTIEENLKRENTLFTSITLHDLRNNKNLLSIGKYDTNAPTSIQTPLKNAENIQLDFVKRPIQPGVDFYLYTAMLILLTGLFSLLFYLYFCNLLKNRYSLNHALSIALQKDHFYPVYQAVWNEEAQSFGGAEVFLRWQTGVDEYISPDYFIEEAEKTGLIIPITLQLIENAFQQCKALLHHNRSFTLAFNVCPLNFCTPDFFPGFYKLCALYEVLPQQIIFELTERDLFNRQDDVIVTRMQELRSKGFSMAVDDFGTGHASISYLRHFPFNYLKIDKLFVHAIGTGAITETLNQAIIDLANTLQLDIIAEGVETAEHYEFLRQKGVNLLQGWYFCNVISDKELIYLIANPETKHD